MSSYFTVFLLVLFWTNLNLVLPCVSTLHVGSFNMLAACVSKLILGITLNWSSWYCSAAVTREKDCNNNNNINDNFLSD